ncbi:MAG: hypothetical protein AAFV88_21565 [Planctomycetota bacterium]
MNLLAHITPAESPAGLVLFFSGVAVGFTLAFSLGYLAWKPKRSR